MLSSYKARGAILALVLLGACSAALLLAPDAGYVLVPAVPVVMIVVMLLKYFVVAPRTARATYRKQKSLHHPYTLSWSEAGLKTTGAGGEWTMPWTDYLKLAENGETILFYQSPRLFNMLPKRALNEGQIADILQCAASLRR